MRSSNRLSHIICVSAVLGLAPLTSIGHELTRIGIVSGEASVGGVVEIAVEFSPRANVQECGINVDFGDGTADYMRVKGRNPSGSIRHVFRQAGMAVIKVEGKTRFRGLNSVFACTGGVKTTAVRVLPEGFAARRAAAEGARQAELQRAQAEVQAAKADAAEAQRQRDVAQQTAQRALIDKAAAERRASVNVSPAPIAVAAPVTQTVVKPKPEPPKPKSSLDL